jgi:phospholipid/cholesterol/gamma-HCH transport system ATP-binding protein
MATTTTPLISFQKLGMEFQQQRVLTDINLDITRGQTVVIVGESGCGKTVLLKLMIALLRPTSGSVTFDGKTLANLDDTALTRERLRFGQLDRVRQRSLRFARAA